MLEPRWTNFLLNCPPNRDGLLDAAIVARLGEVGAAWSQNASRPPLPAQGAADRAPVHAGRARPRPAARAANAIDGINDNNRQHDLAADGRAAPVDHARSRREQPDVGMLAYVPRVQRQRRADRRHVTSYGILTSTERHDVHRGDAGNVAGRRQDEGRDLRPGRRPLRPPRGPRRQRDDRRGRHRNHRRGETVASRPRAKRAIAAT